MLRTLWHMMQECVDMAWGDVPVQKILASRRDNSSCE